MLRKNNVSYFEAGYRAGLIDAGKTKEEVDHLFYSTITVPSLMRDFMNVYDRSDDGELAIQAMEQFVEEKRSLSRRGK